jgi:hypothetical protein
MTLIKDKTSFPEQLHDLLSASALGPEAMRQTGLAECPDEGLLVNLRQLKNVLRLSKSAISRRLSQCEFQAQAVKTSTSEIETNFAYLKPEAHFWRKWIKQSKTSVGGPEVKPTPGDPYWAAFFTMP